MTAVTIQSKNIVSNEVKDSYALLGPSYKKKSNGLFGQPNQWHFLNVFLNPWFKEVIKLNLQNVFEIKNISLRNS